MPQTASNFNPDVFLAQTDTMNKVGGFDPDSFLSETNQEAPAAPKPVENAHDFVPFIKAQGKGLAHLAKEAGSGLMAAAKNPSKTASDVVDSLGNVDGEGIYRAVRSVPIVGDAINHLNIAARGVPGYLKGGDEGQLEAVNAQDAYEQAQKESDAQHEKEHPLTDFIQKNVGLVALPEGKMAQSGLLAVDAFQKSMAQGNSVMDALKDARNVAMLAGTALNAGEAVAKVPRMVGKYAAKEAGVTPEAIARYTEAPEAVNAASKFAEQPESLKNIVDDRVRPINEAVDNAQTGVMNAKDAVAETRQPPVSMASEIPEHLDTQGAKLKDLSGQAFDILEKEGQSFPVQDLQAAVAKKMDSLKIGGEVLPSIGPDATAYKALGQFNDMLNEVGAKIGDEVPAPVVKELIQQLDGVSAESYTTNAGALSPAAAGNLAQVRRVFNQTLREASPNYAAKMDELAPRVSIVSEMSQVFGNETKAMIALKAAADPMSPRGIQVREMLGKYDALNGTDFAKRVADYYEQPKAAFETAQTELAKAKETAAGVNKLGPNSTESTLKSIQAGRNIEARKQLEGLDPELARTVQDAAIAKQFGRPTTNGSRKAVIGRGIGGAAGAGLGAAIAGPSGAVVGGFLGQAAGGFAGGLADLYGGQAVKAALDAGIKLDKIANTPYIKPLMEAAKRSPKSLAVVHYMMSQTDPKYQALTTGGQ
jgi:hypothetical protein